MKFYMENDGKVEFERDDFTDEEFNMLKMMYNMADEMTYAMNDKPYYTHSFADTLFKLMEKLGLVDLLY